MGKALFIWLKARGGWVRTGFDRKQPYFILFIS